ncbi:hypothetical protein C8R45DRAFT_1218303 [Mycena sanguinolenta]|nr:hypothetical protein C8R45DRAFT_1218303 [Mycena sanguinolenta]
MSLAEKLSSSGPPTKRQLWRIPTSSPCKLPASTFHDVYTSSLRFPPFSALRLFDPGDVTRTNTAPATTRSKNTKYEFRAFTSVADLPLARRHECNEYEEWLLRRWVSSAPLSFYLVHFAALCLFSLRLHPSSPQKLTLDVAATINESLLISEPEKHARHAALHKVVTTHTSHTWADALVKMLLGQLDGKVRCAMHPDTIWHIDKGWCMVGDRAKHHALHPARRAVEPVRHEEAADYDTPSPQPSSRWNRHHDVVYIISKHDGAFLEQHLGHLKRVWFCAEHGGFMRTPGKETWMNLLTEKWIAEVEELFRSCALEVLVGKKNLKVRPIAVNKGEIVKRLLYKNPDAELIFAQGMARHVPRPHSPWHGCDEGHDGGPLLSVTLLAEGSGKGSGSGTATPVELAIKPDCVFTTAVEHSSKRARPCHDAAEIVEHMLGLVG